MSMQIDYSTPLTLREREYLDSRGRYADIERADLLSGTETPESGSGDGTGLQQQPLLTSEARAAERDRLMARLAQLDSEGGSPDEDADEVAPYEEWKLDDLKAEIDVRNEARPADAKLAKTGKAVDLAARLRKDDEDQAAPTV
jgi:hypothetical protein